MKEKILTELEQIEQREDVFICFACESGSRAWGFPSSDSDFDVRFIYLRPIEWYLSIDFERKRDVIEEPIEDSLDINGWDLRKALHLLTKSNPPLMEWLGSPIVYLEKSSIAQNMRNIAPAVYSTKSAFHHYLNMAKNNHRSYLQDNEVKIKRYFYILRPLLAMQWLEKDKGVVPTEFAILVEELVKDSELSRAINKLLLEKQQGAELDLGPKIQPIEDFIQVELAHWESFDKDFQMHQPNVEGLNDLFRNALDEIWSN